MNHEGQMHSIVLKCLGYNLELNGKILPPTYDGQLSDLQLHILVSSTQLLFFCSQF